MAETFINFKRALVKLNLSADKSLSIGMVDIYRLYEVYVLAEKRKGRLATPED